FKANVMRSDVPDITASHFQLLLMLKIHGNLSNSELSEQLQMARPNISTLLAKLSELGFVQKETDTADRRYASFSLSEAGTAFLKDQRSKKKKLLSNQLTGLSEQEHERLEVAFQEIISIIGKIE
ncbi:MAG: MarR family winged helix-turn-helix transcriptional regulator, partial [Bacilli bacterium]